MYETTGIVLILFFRVSLRVLRLSDKPKVRKKLKRPEKLHPDAHLQYWDYAMDLKKEAYSHAFEAGLLSELLR